MTPEEFWLEYDVRYAQAERIRSLSGRATDEDYARAVELHKAKKTKRAQEAA